MNWVYEPDEVPNDLWDGEIKTKTEANKGYFKAEIIFLPWSRTK